MNITRLLPPILVDTALLLTRKRHGFSGDYQTFQSAQDSSTTYESDAVIELYKSQLRDAINNHAKNDIKIDDRSMRLLAMVQISMTNLKIDEVQIIDFGGSFGNHYFESLKLIKSKIKRYVVCESPRVSNELSRIDSPISFVDNLSNYLDKEFDVCIASCSLPYLEKPYEFLKELMRISNFIVLDRMPIVAELTSDTVTLQNTKTKFGHKVSYPAWFFSEQILLEKIAELDGTILASWDVPEDRPVFKWRRRPYIGYLIKTN